MNQFPASDPSAFFQEASLDHVFGDVWTRPGLTREEMGEFASHFAHDAGFPIATVFTSFMRITAELAQEG